MQVVRNEGRRVVAAERIPIGSLVWRFCDGVNAQLRASGETEELVRMIQSDLSLLDKIYPHGNQIIEVSDSGAIAHSETCNVGMGGKEDYCLYALRDIPVGEEITQDFGVFTYPAWWSQALLVGELSGCGFMP